MQFQGLPTLSFLAFSFPMCSYSAGRCGLSSSTQWQVETLAFITQSINSVIYQACQSGWLIMGCHGGEWHIRKVWLTMPVAGAGLLPPSPVINVLSACNPTPTLNEARIHHLSRVADVRGKGIQVAGNNILFLACVWHVWQALKTTKKACVSTNFSDVTFSCAVLCCMFMKGPCWKKTSH